MLPSTEKYRERFRKSLDSRGLRDGYLCITLGLNVVTCACNVDTEHNRNRTYRLRNIADYLNILLKFPRVEDKSPNCATGPGATGNDRVAR